MTPEQYQVVLQVAALTRVAELFMLAALGILLWRLCNQAEKLIKVLEKIQ